MDTHFLVGNELTRGRGGPLRARPLQIRDAGALASRLCSCSKAVYLLGSTRESFNTSRLRQLFVLLNRSSLFLVFSSKDENAGPDIIKHHSPVK